jgi:hypothetical protein
MAGIRKDEDEAKLETLAKRLLSTPPEPREKRDRTHPKRKKPATEERKKGKAKDVSKLVAEAHRLREETSFLARAVRQLRDVAIAAHIAAERGAY